MLVSAAGAALAGLLHATAAGAVVLGGLTLAVPDAVDAGGPAEAVGQAVAFGLAGLRVPLESGDVQGTFAPLSGLLLTLWGLASAVRRGGGRVSGRRGGDVAATGVAFALACAGAAAGAGALTTIEPSVPWAAAAGLAWGCVGAAAAIYTRAASKPSVPGPGGASLRRLGIPVVPPGFAPGVLTTCIAFGLAGAWFLVAAVVGLAGGSLRELAGGILLALAVAPNAAAALVAVGLGSSVDVVLGGTLLPDPLRESLSLPGGSLYVLVLVIVPVAATLAGGRLAAAATPGAPIIVRGLRNGTVLGAALAGAAWAGSLGATAATAGDRVSVRLGFSGVTAFALAVVWGAAGAYLGPRLPWPRRGSRVDAP